MVFKIEKLKKKVDKIISAKQLGSTLTMKTYTLGVKDAFGKRVMTLNDTTVSFGAKISSTGNKQSGKGFNEEKLTLIVSYSLGIYPEDNKLKIFEFMGKDYEITSINPIDGIQGSGAGTEIVLRLYEGGQV